MSPTCYLPPGSPPSSYAVAAVYEGEPGSWVQVSAATLARTAFILPGLALAGVRGKKLWVGSVLGSATITTALFIIYGFRRAKAVQKFAAYTAAV